MNKQLMWELEWVENNRHLYSSHIHAMAVKSNITKRYHIIELEKKLKAAGIPFVGLQTT